MNANAAPSPTTVRLRGNLRTAFGGVWRMTWPRFFAPRHLWSTAAAIGALGVVAWLEARHEPQQFGDWIVTSYLSFLAPLIAFVAAAGAIHDELQSSTIDYVLTRAVPRPAFVGFKYAAYLIGVQLEFLLAAVVLVGVGVHAQTPGLVAAIPTLVITQAALVLAFSGLGFLCGTVTSRYVVMGLIYGGIIEGGVGQIPTQLNRLSMTHHARAALEPFFAAGAPTTMATDFATLGSTVIVMSVFAAITLAIAITVFSLRELTTHAES